jgi:hypothetical protein
MGIDLLCFERLVHHAKPAKMALLGYPELLVTEAKLIEAYGAAIPPVDEQSTKAAAWHGWIGKLHNTDIALKQMGFEPTYFDYYRFRHCEVVVDLNVKTSFPTEYDFVCDYGTTEHIFNVGQAWENLYTMCMPGGTIIMSNPMNRPNHGFWSFSPTAYADFWQANGCTITSFMVYDLINKGQGPTTYNAMDLPLEHHTQRIQHGSELNVYCEIQMPAVKTSVKWPIQTKYRKLVEARS